MKAGIKGKIMLVTGACIVVAMLVLGVVLNKVITDNERKLFEEESNLQAAQVDNTVNIFLNGLRDGLVNMTNDPVLRQAGKITVYIDGPADASGNIAMEPEKKGGYEAAAYATFKRFVESNKGTVSVVSLGTTDGGFLQYPAIKRKKGYDSRARGWYKDSMKDVEKVRITKPFMTSKGTPTIGIFSVIKDNNGKPYGVLGLNVDLPIVTDMIGNIKIGETGYMMMVDGSGVIIASPKQPELNFKKLAEVQSDLASLATAEKGLHELTIDGTARVVNVYTSKQNGYKYITIVDDAQLMASVNSMRMILAVVLLVAIGIVFAVIYTLCNRLLGPLDSITAAAEQIANGDIRNLVLTADTDDEVGRLTAAFATMVGNLKGLLVKIKSSATDVSASADDLSNASEQCAQTITHVAGNVSEIAGDAQQQNDSLNRVVEEIRTMADNISAISKLSDKMSTASANAGEAAAEGEAAIRRAVAQMDEVKRTVESSAAEVTKLGARSQEIGEIIGTISGIAEQTNLLALNAAIEAARAGEHGRGFAVVADEVRKLAEQSAQAASEVASIIQAIQNETQAAVSSMKYGTSAVQEGGSVVTEAGKQFARIVSNINEVDGFIQEAVRDAVAASDSSQEVLTQAEEFATVTRGVAENIDTISSATQEQSATMQEISASSHKLTQLSDNLNNEVDKFKF